MTRHSRRIATTRSLHHEVLETRHLLAATADVVLLIDRSNSFNGGELYPWFGDVIEDLETNLNDQGIGSIPGLENRYSIVTFGEGTSGTSHTLYDWHTERLDNQGNPVTIDTLAQEIRDLDVDPDGGSEDVWEAAWFALEDIVLAFRSNAAVHFIALTDAPSFDVDPETHGPDPAVRANGSAFQATLGEMLDSLSKEELLADDGVTPNYVSDSTITIIAGSDYIETSLDSFDESTDPLFGWEILGVDISVEDEWDVDRRTGGTNNSATAFVYKSGENPPLKAVELDDDFTTGPVVSPDYEYDNIHSALQDDDFLDENGQVEYPTWLNQTSFEGELYAFLAWDSGGTYWDVSPMLSSTPPSTDLNLQFQFAVAADTADKIVRQVADFDLDFTAVDSFTPALDENNDFDPDYLGDFGDVATWIFARMLQEEIGIGDDILGKFDLDADGSLDDDDIELLVETIFRGLMGDADWNGFVNAADQNALALNWQETDVYNWAEGDFNGDGLVNAADLNYIGENWQQGPNPPP